MRSAKYYLEKDTRDKFSALAIDTNCTELHNKSPNIYFTDQTAKIEGKYVYMYIVFFNCGSYRSN